MRLHVGAIPESPDFEPVEPWRAIREPSPILMQLIALPIGLAMGILFVFAWMSIGTIDWGKMEEGIGTWLLATVLGTIFIHELLHAVVHPSFGISSRSIIGIWPSKLLFYAHYDHEMSRNRFLLVFLSPLFMISVVPLVIAYAIQYVSGWWLFVSCFNALSACGDVVGVILIASQVPSNAIVRNQGWRTYWRFAHDVPSQGSGEPHVDARETA